jgi:hypothetical protein
MDTEPQTPDVDLPGQEHHDQADLDIEVEPEPGAQPSGSPDGDADQADDPELGNTLIRPENS